MPFINPDPTTSTASVINQAGDNAMQGIGAYQQRQAQDEAQNRVLHPLTQHWLQKVIKGEMDPAEAAAHAHAEHDAIGTPHYGQSQSSRAASATPSGGGMGAAARPMTARDASDAEGVGRMAANSASSKANLQYVKNAGAQQVATTRAGAQTDVADINNTGKGDRLDEVQKYKEKQLKEKGAEFDSMMKYRYDSLDANEEKLTAQIHSRQSIANTKQGNTEALKLLEGDRKMLTEWSAEIARLQQEKTRAGGMLQPAQREATDKMIRDLQKKVEHLNFSIDVQVRQRGGRAGLTAEPGAGGDTYPSYSPGTSGAPPSNMQRPPTAPLAPPAAGNPSQTPDIPSPGGEKTIWVEDISSGAQVQKPASEVEGELRTMGVDKWKKKYKPITRGP